MAKPSVVNRVTPLFSADRIAARVDALARGIAACDMRDVLVVSVLKGSFIFAADLVRALHRQGLEPQIEFLLLGSYGRVPKAGPSGSCAMWRMRLKGAT